MISKLTIQNFKSHRLVELEDLGRINLLLGRNNSGKTALLEALFFLSFPSNPQEALAQLNEQRGYRPDESSEEVWSSLFHNWNTSQDIRIEAQEGKAIQTLRISPLRGERRIQSSSAVLESGELAGATRGLSFEFKSSPGETIAREVTSLKAARRSPSPFQAGRPVGFVYARGVPKPDEEAQRYSRLDARRQSGEVDEALKIIEPRLGTLKVLATQDGGMLYGDLGTPHLMPLPLMGDGLLRALSIASTLVTNQGGLVLIDEVENGLHYSVQFDLWRLIVEMARRLDVQVFATTHSSECAYYALKAVESLHSERSLRAYRFDLVEGITRVVDYSAGELAAVIQSEQEYR